MPKEYTMIRIQKSDWKRIKELAKKDKRTIMGFISTAIEYYAQDQKFIKQELKG